ncbi:SDR family oxidoreductase [Gordonia sp. HY002]|uniref:SDR family oxidoreductase n=1 Tax=Gordonia zhenghanii TaxID=2911516 RepID=UPI001EF00F26|nr:SDR family oxidoreductase [Gordonia zhenghanii]MCF8570488.1 SDR family oxidoreductase [Gordonia zhenghanii]MCF8602555.1 SDR family oxidoreductase [Gordonia zhenghanii]
MTGYLVTGASGFIGRRVLQRLLDADADARITTLVRPGSVPSFARLLETIPGGDRVVTVPGDLTVDGLDIRDLSDLGDIDHVIHLAAIYDMAADAASQEAANVEGTRRVAALAVDLDAMLHHISSIAVAGDYDGAFTEADFDKGQCFPTPYHRTKFEAEKVVRDTPDLRWRVYRPTAVVGDSRTGEMDKIDGPYYFFGQLASLGKLPSFMKVPMPDLGRIELVPVDYVADAIVALVDHRPADSGLVFHLADPTPHTITDMVNALAPAFDAPRGFDVVPNALVRPFLAAGSRGPLRAARDLVVGQMGIPPVMADLVSLPVDFRSDESVTTLRGLGVELPDLNDYGPRLWRYWYDHLDPARFRRADARGPLVGKNILITGSSAGIGRATASMCVMRGGNVFLVARDVDRLAEAVAELEADTPEDGFPLGRAYAYQADITDEAAVQTVVKSIIAEHGYVDVLVNNAGRSIRRSTLNSVNRSHDYQRTMAVNYFGAVYMTLALLPHMVARQTGHVVNVSSIAVQSRGPRFGAYSASKAALEAFSAATAAETLSDHITFSTVRLPLTRTRMIAPTDAYESQHGVWSVDKAATRVLHAIVDRPKRANTFLGDLVDAGHNLLPRLTTRIMHQEFLMVGESSAALGQKN